MACRQSADCRHYNAWWCDRRSGCDDFETRAKETKSEPVIIPAEEPEKKQAKRKKAGK